MATLFRKKRDGKELPNWYCSFQVTEADGTSRQIHRATRKANKREAMAVALRMEQEARKETGCDDPTSQAILAVVREAGELATQGKLTAAKGRALIGEILALTGTEANSYTARAWVEHWTAEKDNTVKPGTAHFYRATTTLFLDFLGERADAPLEAITSKDVRAFRDSRRKAGRTAKTANQNLKVLRSLLGDAVKDAAILHNPAAAIKTLDETDSTPREPFTLEEVARLYRTAPSTDWQGVILIGAFTGLRLVDACNLKAGNLDLERGVIHLTPRKTERKGTTVEIPLHPEILDYFAKHPPSPFDATPLFPSLAKDKSGGRNGLSAQFRAIMEAAEVARNVTRKSEDGAARETASRSFHSLRHTFTSWLAKANVPEEVRQKMTGHTDSRTHQKYTHHELETLKSGVERLARIQTKEAG
ncbi:tyrosine-type recombinase/integrase [Roseibacillus ishigakijimensis]|uniref:Tyrosine-type recombinase/integrase n=1 Tax=Roseibacillus ishigakijimensis TaxID=454146 RepID=A0A934RUR5_9BACT|nr:tyrosine-type recombinase/integrase [Roseibacillus ishigakijimensis]MBK1835374.1 tyrosine-type recombinase/integrase [Roseibacillus ishigakijimensis]